ncbi:MAG: methylenetetrahydrofolate reductase C-terminal domain-containing protein [Deltaproteobacteria bacterium]|nr:methylenetetrahydrofolate reductase C-terminal domain-containing protein [Deltaproteobacteria bacterium]
MIVAERKPIAEIMEMVTPFRRLLLVGCDGCVTVCNSGGRKEVGVLASALKLASMKAGQEMEIKELTLERQCDPEFIAQLRPLIQDYQAVLSAACGAGVQLVAEHFKDKPVFPALNTTFLGVAQGQGVWSERCQGCGNCLLGITGGICPVSRCAKRLFNGPCGGSSQGKCEVNPETDCAWQMVYDRLKALDKLNLYAQFIPPKDWSTDRDGGPRSYLREDLAL